MNRKKLPKHVLNIQFLVLSSYSSIAVLSLLPLFLDHLGGSPGQIGFLVGIFSFASFFSRPLSGWLLSKVNPQRVMMAGLLLVLAVTVLYLFVKRLGWFIVFLRILHGIGFSFFLLAALLMVVLTVRENLRTYALGVVSTGFMIPLLVVPALGEEIIKRYGFLFFFLTAVILSSVPVVYALLTRIRLPREGEDDGLASVGFFRLLAKKRVLYIFLLTFVFEVALSSSLSFVPLLVQEGFSLRAGFFYSSLGLTAVSMRLLGGRWLKFWGSPRLVLPALYFLCGGAVLLYFARSNQMLSLSGVVWGLGVGVLYPHLSALSVKGIRSRDKGKALSLFAAAVDLGFALGPVTIGWLSQTFGVRSAFLPLALITFVASSVLMLLGRSSLAADSPASLS
jgi:predicted MFS family arabinose efflux permease